MRTRAGNFEHMLHLCQLLTSPTNLRGGTIGLSAYIYTNTCEEFSKDHLIAKILFINLLKNDVRNTLLPQSPFLPTTPRVAFYWPFSSICCFHHRVSLQDKHIPHYYVIFLLHFSCSGSRMAVRFVCRRQRFDVKWSTCAFAMRGRNGCRPFYLIQVTRKRTIEQTLPHGFQCEIIFIMANWLFGHHIQFDLYDFLIYLLIAWYQFEHTISDQLISNKTKLKNLFLGTK